MSRSKFVSLVCSQIRLFFAGAHSNFPWSYPEVICLRQAGVGNLSAESWLNGSHISPDYTSHFLSTCSISFGLFSLCASVSIALKNCSTSRVKWAKVPRSNISAFRFVRFVLFGSLVTKQHIHAPLTRSVSVRTDKHTGDVQEAFTFNQTTAENVFRVITRRWHCVTVVRMWNKVIVCVALDKLTAKQLLWTL